MATTERATLLLVEDEAIIALNQRKQLERAGYAVLHASSGARAVDAVRDHLEIELILMDIDLGPGLDGTEAARRILDARRLPIVFLTSHSEAHIVDRVKGITRYGYVLKSSGAFVLQEAISMAFELFAANERYRALFDTVADAVMVIDEEDGTIVDVNDVACALFRGDRDRLIGRRAWEFSSDPDDTRAGVALPGGAAVDIPARTLYRLDGSGFTAHITARHAVIQGVGRNITTIRDVTREVERQRELERAYDRFEALFEHAPVAMAVGDLATGRYRMVNGAFAALSGYRPEEAVGRTPPELGMSEEAGYRAFLESVRDRGVVADPGAEVTTADGRVIRARITARRLTIDDAEAVLTTAEDVTDSVRLEQELGLYRAYLDEAQEVANIGHYQLDVGTGHWTHSRQLDAIFGIDADYDATVEGWARIIHPDDRDEMIAYLTNEVMGAGVPFDREYRIVDQRSGEPKWVHGRGKLRVDADGNPTAMFGTIQDITARIANQRRLETLVEERERLMQELNHRVKNNLAMVSALLSFKEGSSADACDFGDIRAQIEAIAAVHDQLTLESNSLEVRADVYLTDLARTVFTTLGRPDIEIAVAIDAIRLPAKLATSIGLIVNELATNAAKHAMPVDGTHVVFTVELHAVGSMDDDGRPRRVTLDVGNNGTPIPEGLSFSTSDSLGLRLVGTLVQSLGGTAEIFREPHTRFLMSIPL